MISLAVTKAMMIYLSVALAACVVNLLGLTRDGLIWLYRCVACHIEQHDSGKITALQKIALGVWEHISHPFQTVVSAVIQFRIQVFAFGTCLLQGLLCFIAAHSRYACQVVSILPDSSQ